MTNDLDKVFQDEENLNEHVEEQKTEVEAVAETVETATEEPVAVVVEAAIEPAVEVKPEHHKSHRIRQELPRPEDFDWTSTGKRQENYSLAERVKLEDLYNKTFNSIAEQEVVEGTIVGLNDRLAFVLTEINDHVYTLRGLNITFPLFLNGTFYRYDKCSWREEREGGVPGEIFFLDLSQHRFLRRLKR
jgi:hypothetical protein